jgi:chromosome segregation ATPase
LQGKRTSELEINVVKSNQEISDLKKALDLKTKELADFKAIAQQEKDELKVLAEEELKQENERLNDQLRSATDIANELQLRVENLTAQAQQANLDFQMEIATAENRYESQIKDLENRLVLVESKNTELLANSRSSVEPLLLQISQLESQYRLAKTDWESIEMALLQRAQSAERKNGELAKSVESSLGRVEESVIHN